jgi:hypothetical protein
MRVLYQAGVIAINQIKEQKMSLLAVVAISLLPIIAHQVNFLGYNSSKVYDFFAFSGATLITVISGLMGLSLFRRDYAERRISFYLARPVAAFSLWLGKVTGAGFTIASSLGILLLVAKLVLGNLNIAQQFLFGLPLTEFLLGLPIIFTCGIMLGITFRSKSRLLILDILLVPVATYWLTKLFWEVEVLEAGYCIECSTKIDTFMPEFWSLFGIIGLLSTLGAVVWGGSDLKQVHKVLSGSFWTGVVALLIGFSVYGYCYINRFSSLENELITVNVTKLDFDKSKYNIERFALSADKSWLAWTEVHHQFSLGFSTEAWYRILKITNLDKPRQPITEIILPKSLQPKRFVFDDSEVLVSDDGKYCVLIDEGQAICYDLSTKNQISKTSLTISYADHNYRHEGRYRLTYLKNNKLQFSTQVNIEPIPFLRIQEWDFLNNQISTIATIPGQKCVVNYSKETIVVVNYAKDEKLDPIAWKISFRLYDGRTRSTKILIDGEKSWFSYATYKFVDDNHIKVAGKYLVTTYQNGVMAPQSKDIDLIFFANGELAQTPDKLSGAN